MKKLAALLNQTGVINPLLILLAIAGVIIFILIAQTAPFAGKEETLYPKPPAEAAGKGKGANTAILTVTPNPVTANTDFEISGDKFSPNEVVVVGVPGYIPFGQVSADSTGHFTYLYTRDLSPWTYTVEAYQQKGKNWLLKASTTVTVVTP